MSLITQISTEEVQLAGRFDVSMVVALRKHLELMISACAGKKFTIQLQELENGNSALLSLLLCCVRKSEQLGCQLILTGMSRSLFDMARVGGVESILPLAELR